MDWARILAYVTGTADQELLAQNEYLVAENPCGQKQGVGRAEERITAVPADAVVAARLAVEPGAPLLMITRTVFDTKGRSVEHLTALYPPERHQYSVSLGP